MAPGKVCLPPGLNRLLRISSKAAGSLWWLEHDPFGKPEVPARIKSEGMLFGSCCKGAMLFLRVLRCSQESAATTSFQIGRRGTNANRPAGPSTRGAGFGSMAASPSGHAVSLTSPTPERGCRLKAIFPAHSPCCCRETPKGATPASSGGAATRSALYLCSLLLQAASSCTSLPFMRSVRCAQAYLTSSVTTLKDARVHGPNEVTIATSVASRPRAIRIRPIRGWLWRASNVCHCPPR